MKNILIVEDDKAMHEIYRDIFEGHEKDYNLSFAINPREALKKLRKEEDIDLVILDIIMEPSSGEEVYLRLRQDKELAPKRIPVIVVSVIKKDDLLGLAKHNNLIILEKPIRKDAFLRKIGQVLRARKVLKKTKP